MKNTRLALLAIGLSTATLFAFTALQENTIKGTVSTADKATKAWAISTADTATAEVKDGAFELKVDKAGTYNIIIEAQEPFSNTRKSNVEVKDGQVTEVGEIKLVPKQ